MIGIITGRVIGQIIVRGIIGEVTKMVTRDVYHAVRNRGKNDQVVDVVEAAEEIQLSMFDEKEGL